MRSGRVEKIVFGSVPTSKPTLADCKQRLADLIVHVYIYYRVSFRATGGGGRSSYCTRNCLTASTADSSSLLDHQCLNARSIWFPFQANRVSFQKDQGHRGYLLRPPGSNSKTVSSQVQQCFFQRSPGFPRQDQPGLSFPDHQVLFHPRPSPGSTAHL